MPEPCTFCGSDDTIARFTSCKYCGRKVIYYACNDCNGEVFLDHPEEHDDEWVRHNDTCPSSDNPYGRHYVPKPTESYQKGAGKPIKDGIYYCPECGSVLTRKRLMSSMAYVCKQCKRFYDV
nr:hypothetical protein [Candidatus Sigynarchaeum springense]